MSQGVTTSIRLSNELRSHLEKVAQSVHRGKNWIITKALEEYLDKIEKNSLLEEARRQSLLASQSDQKMDDWEQNTDTSGWI